VARRVSSHNLLQEAPMATDLDTTLANIALATNNHPRGRTPKLASVGDDPDERFFMLATFCFDLSRKLKYISYALQEYYAARDEASPSPAFVAKIQKDECYINPKSTSDPLKVILPWEAMAIRSEEVMIRLHQELLDAGYPPHPPAGGCPGYSDDADATVEET
jgi:hypothetical protein